MKNLAHIIVCVICGGLLFSLPARSGTVVAWGANNYGQISGVPNWTNVVVAWGWNYYGQTNIPAGLNNVVAIAAGSFHSLAMMGSSDPAIIRQPAPVYANVTGRLLLSVGAVGSQPLAFQWLTNGTPIPGATNWWLDLPATSPNNSGNYSVIVSNALGVVVSSNAAVTVLAVPPYFLTQPASRTNIGGGPLTLSTAVGGSSPLNYQWQKDGAAIVSATNFNLLFNSLTRANGGVYSLVASNAFGSATSSNATLRVLMPQWLQPPALNPDGSFTFSFSDSDGGPLSASDAAHFSVLASTNLLDWLWLTNPPVFSNGFLLFQDASVTNLPQRYYRVIESP